MAPLAGLQKQYSAAQVTEASSLAPAPPEALDARGCRVLCLKAFTHLVPSSVTLYTQCCLQHPAMHLYLFSVAQLKVTSVTFAGSMLAWKQLPQAQTSEEVSRRNAKSCSMLLACKVQILSRRPEGCWALIPRHLWTFLVSNS